MASKKKFEVNEKNGLRNATRKMKELERDLKTSESRATDATLKCAKLEQRIRMLEAERDIYRQVGRVTAKGFNLDKLLRHYMELVLQATRTEAGTLYLMTPEEDQLDFRIVIGPTKEQLEGRTIPIAEGISGWVVRTGMPYVSTDVKADPKWSKRISREIDFETRDILCVPLKTRKKVLGAVLVLNKKGEDPFTKSDLDAITTLSSQIAVVIENAYLFEQSSVRAHQFENLAELSAILNSNLDTKKVRTAAIEAITRLLNCEVGSLLMVDHGKKELYFEVALGEKGDLLKEIRLKMGEGIAGWVAEKGEPVLITDTSKDERWASRVDRKSKFQTRNMVCVPVTSHDKIIGVLQAINKKGNKLFDQRDLELLCALANPVAIAVENAGLYEEQREMFLETAEALAEAIEKRDLYTGGHTKRVSKYSMAICKYMKMDDEVADRLLLASILHDIGKIGISEDVLNKKGKLTDEEFDEMKKHPQYGYDILRHITRMDKVMPGMRGHHERYDGKGYPDGLKGEKIPLLARVIAVADTFDAMTTDRPYRKALSDQQAIKELKKYKGLQFDAKVVRAFLRAYANKEIVSPNRQV